MGGGAAVFRVARASPLERRDAQPLLSGPGFLNPILIDALDLAACRERSLRRRSRRLATRSSRLPARRRIFAGWATKREASPRVTPPSRGPRRPTRDSIFVDYERYVAAGGEALRRFAIFEAIAARGGEDWRLAAAAARGERERALRAPRPRNPRRSASPCSASGSRPPARRRRRTAKPVGSRSASIVTRRRRGPDGAENWARGRKGWRATHRRRAPDRSRPRPDVESAAPDDRFGRATVARLLRADRGKYAFRRHAAHRPPMGLTRLFVISVGRQNGRGRLSRLSGRRPCSAWSRWRASAHNAPSSAGPRPVPQGFSEKLRRSDISACAFWFRAAAAVHAAKDYPPCRRLRTTRLPTLAGWVAADVAERLGLAMIDSRSDRRSSSASTKNARSPTRSPRTA